MNREKLIAMLEQHIARLESAQVDPNEEDQQHIQAALDDAKGVLERIKAGDEGAVQEALISWRQDKRNPDTMALAMTREEMIAMLEQHIQNLEHAQADPEVDPQDEDWQMMQDALEGATGLLQRVQEGDEAAIQEVSELLETG